LKRQENLREDEEKRERVVERLGGKWNAARKDG